MAAVPIDAELVRRLLADQYPQWSRLPIHPVLPGGWDNRSFRLGADMLVRLPSAQEYAAQVDKEQQWLPMLAALLPLEVPQPLARGSPTVEFGCPWSVYQWIDGDTAKAGAIGDGIDFARDLASFLNALRGIDATQGPAPGLHNFHRGGALATYDTQARRAITALAGRIDVEAATSMWHEALRSCWTAPPAWLHGDISAGNLLLRNGKLVAVIDFGNLGIGDPACDLTIAWTPLDAQAREVFRNAIGLGGDVWSRARGWALWKALIVIAGHCDTSEVERRQSTRTLEAILHRPR